MGSHLDETSHEIFLGKFENDKIYKAELLQKVKSDICAMLNSNGGRVVIHFKTDSEHIPVAGSPSSKISLVIRKLEQYMMSIIGKSQTVSKINFSCDKDNIIISIKKADSLVTANYNLNLPSQTQVVEVSPWEPLESIIYRQTIPNWVELGSHYQKFCKDKNCGFHESKISQFKNLKATSSKRTTLADRITGKGNKLSRYVSAFANHNGGHVYYGITDEEVVEGEFIQNEKDGEEIIKKVEKVMNKIVWPEQIGQPKRGEQWEIFFEPVVDANSKPVPSTFVVVIYIAPCLGGVFTEEPECYEMVEGKVDQMSFDTWKKRISPPVWLQKSQRKKNIPNSVPNRITWSSGAVRKAFTIDCDELRKMVSNGNWEIFEKECSSFQSESDLHETMNLLILFKQITACNRTGEFKKAHELLDDYKALSSQVQDSFIFEVLGLYLQAALKRASGDLKTLKELLTEALSKAKRVEPGLVTATVYIFAATVSDLIDLESPAILTEKALEHLERVPDSSDVLVAMRRKANIILATFHLGCNVSGQLIKDRIDILSLRKAKACIDAVSESAYEEHPLSVYFEIQLNLVLSIYKYRFSQVNPGQRNHYLRNACRNIGKAQSLAVKYGFTEMVEWSKKNEALCTQELVNCSDHVRNDESDQKSGDQNNQHERTDRDDCVEQRGGNDHRKRSKEGCDSLNPTERVGRQDGREQEHGLKSKKSLKSTESQKENDGRTAGTSRPRDIVEKAKSQVVSSKSQNADDPNVKRNSQVKPENEEALLCPVMEPATNTVQESKAHDSSDKQAQPQRDSISPSGQQKQLRTSLGRYDMSKLVDAEPFEPRTSSPSGTSVILVPTQPETTDYVMKKDEMPVHVPASSAYEGSLLSTDHTGRSPNGSHEFSNFSSSSNRLPVGLFQVQGWVQQLPPTTYPVEPIYRALVPHLPSVTYGGYQPGVLVNHPGPMMRGGCDVRFSYGMPEPIQTSLYQRCPIQQLPILPQMFRNPPRR